MSSAVKRNIYSNLPVNNQFSLCTPVYAVCMCMCCRVFMPCTELCLSRSLMKTISLWMTLTQLTSFLVLVTPWVSMMRWDLLSILSDAKSPLTVTSTISSTRPPESQTHDALWVQDLNKSVYSALTILIVTSALISTALCYSSRWHCFHMYPQTLQSSTFGWNEKWCPKRKFEYHANLEDKDYCDS